MNYKNLILEDDCTTARIFINKHQKIAIEVTRDNFSVENSEIIELEKEDAIELKKELSKLIKLL